VFDLINGLPIHPLVVHAIVVLVPLAALGTIAIAVKPVWRRRYGHLVVACAALATGLTPVATSSGEALEKQVGNPGEHAELGDQLIWFLIPLLLVVAALWWLDRKRATADTGGHPGTSQHSTALKVLGVLGVVGALATTFQVYRIGDSGARAAWGDQVSSGS
jgi:uncharacterized membrane protein